jgi:putative membrane protein
MNKLVFAAIVAASLAPAAVLAAASKAADRTFITDAIQGNLAEIQMGQLAQQKGQNDAVKSFGQMLVTDHQADNDKAKQVASQLGVTPPTQPSAKEKAGYRKLAKLSGAAFDRQFARMMVTDHKQTIAQFQREAKKTNDPLGRYASDSLPVLKKHLDTAEKIESSKSASR